MRKRIKYIIEIALTLLIFGLFFNEIFHLDPSNKSVAFSPYSIMFANAGNNQLIRVILFISFSILILFLIFLILLLIICPIKRVLYYISLVLITLSFVAFTSCGFINQDMSGLFYLVETVYGLSLVGLLAFELLSFKGL